MQRKPLTKFNIHYDVFIHYDKNSPESRNRRNIPQHNRSYIWQTHSKHYPQWWKTESISQFSFYALSSKLVTCPCLYRHERWPWGSEDLYKEPWKRISDHMPLNWRRWGKQESQSDFYLPVHVRNWIKAKKVTEIWGRVIEGSRVKREDKLSRPRMRDPGEVQPGQPVTE